VYINPSLENNAVPYTAIAQPFSFVYSNHVGSRFFNEVKP